MLAFQIEFLKSRSFEDGFNFLLYIQLSLLLASLLYANLSTATLIRAYPYVCIRNTILVLPILHLIATMKLSTIIALLASASTVAAFAPSQSSSGSALSATKADILSEPDTTEFGKIWDPLGLSEIGSDETLAWFRHSEVKHGRIAMAAFVGWWATGAGLRFPGELDYGLDFASIPSKGLDAWEAVPGWGKAQLLIFAGLIEFHDELWYSQKSTHYMRGGTPGKVSKINVPDSGHESK